MSRLSQFVLMAVTVVIFAAIGFCGLPYLWAKAVPGYLNENIGSFLVVDEADFKHSPPELILKNVHLANPAAFGTGDAITIGQVNVVFADYKQNPMHIQSVTFQGIRGKQIERNDTDNFTAIRTLLSNRAAETPRGKLANKVVFKRFVIRDVSVQNEDGSVITLLGNRDLTPIGEMATNPPLQSVILDTLGTVVEQQQLGSKKIIVEGIKDKAKDTIKSIGDSIKNYLTAP